MNARFKSIRPGPESRIADMVQSGREFTIGDLVTLCGVKRESAGEALRRHLACGEVEKVVSGEHPDVHIYRGTGGGQGR